MTKLLPKNWRIESSCGRYVLRITSAGIILSDAVNDPTLFDYQTAQSVCEQFQGLMSLERHIVMLNPKPQEHKTRNDHDTNASHKVADRQPDKSQASGGA